MFNRFLTTTQDQLILPVFSIFLSVKRVMNQLMDWYWTPCFSEHPLYILMIQLMHKPEMTYNYLPSN